MLGSCLGLCLFHLALAPPEPSAAPQVVEAQTQAEASEEVESEEVESEEPSPKQAARAARRAKNQARANDPNRYEWGALPVIAANSDVGVMFGATAIVAKFDPRYAPYRWRAVVSGVASVREFQGTTQVLMQNYFAELDLPGLLDGRLRLRSKLGYDSLPNAGYYGLGNNSGFNQVPADDSTFYRYKRARAYARVAAEFELFPKLALLTGVTLRYLFTDVYENSLLAQQDEFLRESGALSLAPLEDHPEVLLAAGVRYDTRNHELDPTLGMYLELNGRVGVGPTPSGDFEFGAMGVDLRFFLPLGTDRLVLAQRALADVITGRPPLYELDRAGAFPAEELIAGGTGVRGLPAGRYHGRTKILSSTELRLRVAKFALGRQRFRVGLGGFADFGRVWAQDFQAVVEADGSNFAPRWGSGGGIRLRWGETVLLRADVAYSPFGDPGRPVSLYLVSKHAF